jgi:hypothetical protein
MADSAVGMTPAQGHQRAQTVAEQRRNSLGVRRARDRERVLG